jgi:hypothetical protein
MAGPYVRLAPRGMAGLILATLPVLLLNLDRYGHRRAYIAAWVRQLGGLDAEATVLADMFLHLCQTYDIPYPGLPSSSRWGGVPGRVDKSPAGYDLASIQDLVEQVQGQFQLGLQLAQRQGRDRAQLGLVALFSTLRGGLCAIPLSLRTMVKSVSPEAPDPGWSTADRQQLLQAGPGLYRQWSGGNGADACSSGHSTEVIAVTI